MDWLKLHEIKDLRDVYKVVKDEGTEAEQTAFRCATYLSRLKEESLLLFFLGMNFTNIREATAKVEMLGTTTKVAEYLSVSMDEENLDHLEDTMLAINATNLEFSGRDE